MSRQIKHVGGKSFALEVEAGDTIGSLKNKIQESQGITPDYIKLQMKGVALEDDVVVNNLQDGELDMTMTLVGGEEANHCCHFILWFLTGGLWTPFWIAACCDCCCQRPCNS